MLRFLIALSLAAFLALPLTSNPSGAQAQGKPQGQAQGQPPSSPSPVPGQQPPAGAKPSDSLAAPVAAPAPAPAPVVAPFAKASPGGEPAPASASAAPHAIRLTEFVAEPLAARLLGEMPPGWRAMLVRQGGLAALVTPPFCDRAAAELALPVYRERFPLAQAVPATQADSQPRTWSLSLRQLGFERDVVLQSATPTLPFQLPLPASLDLNGATLELRLRMVKSDIPFKLSVMVEGEPVYSGSLPADGLAHELRIPVRPGMRKPGSEGLFVEIFGTFEQGGVRCVDVWSSNLFMVVENSTALTAKVSRPAQNIAGFFDSANTAYRLTLAGNSPALDEASLRLASLLGATQRKGLIRTLDVGPFDPARRTLLVSPPSPGLTGASLCGDTLQVTPEGAGMLTPELLPLLAVKSLKPTARPQAGAAAGPGKTTVSLEQLGITRPQNVRGYGNLPVTFTFFLSELGGLNELNQFTVRYNHSPLSGKEGAFLLVYLNDALVGSRELSRTREPQAYTVALPVEYLSPVNTVRVVFATPRCNPQGGDVEFEGTVMPDSFIESQTPMEPKSLSIGMAGALLRHKGEVTLGEGGVGLEAMANLVKSLSLFNGRVLDFTLGEGGGPKPQAEGVGQGKGPAWRLLGLSPDRLAAYKPLLDLSRGFTVVNPLTGQVLVDGESGDGLVVLQAFRDDRNRPCIALSASKPGLTVPAEMLSWERLRGIGGNLAVLDGERWVSVKVGEVLEIRYSGEVTLQALWRKYRLFIVLGVGVLFFGILASWWRISAGGKGREKAD